MEVSDFFAKLLGVVEEDSGEVEPSGENEPSGGNEPSGEVEPTGEKDSSVGKDLDVRKIIREELESIMSEAYEVEQKKQKAARAATVQKVSAKEPERSVEDIMEERYKKALGVKEKEKE